MSGLIRKAALVGLSALLLLAAPASVASAKTGGFMEGWFNRTADSGDLPNRVPGDLLGAAKKTGADIARFNVSWCQLEPTEGNFPQQPWETVIDQMRQIMADPNGNPNVEPNGMRPLPILINAPIWARSAQDRPLPGDPQFPCSKRNDNDLAYPPDDAHVPDWNQFIGRFIRCMRGIGNAGQGCPAAVTPPGPAPTPTTPGGFEAGALPIQGYEIWNEPNLGKYWGKSDGTLTTDDADRFVRMVRAAFVLTHDRPVVLGGLSFPEDTATEGNFGDRTVTAKNYINRVYNLYSDVPQFDAIGIHPYGKFLHTSAVDARDRFFDFRNKVRNAPPAGHGDDQTQIWVTEIGDDGCKQSDWGDVACRPNDFELQSQRLVNMWTGPNEIPVPVIIYYRLMDADFDSGRLMGVLPFNQFSNFRPAYCGLANQWGGVAALMCPQQ